MTLLNCFLFESFGGTEKDEFKTISVINRSFLSEAGVALIFFAFVFWIKPKNEVGFGRTAQLI